MSLLLIGLFFAIIVGGISVNALKVRRANTNVELPSGGSLVMAGLISEDTRQNVDGERYATRQRRHGGGRFLDCLQR